LLSNIRIILAETTHPGNIGAVARAMKNMGLHDLRLVSPKIFPSADATSRASGADGVLSDAVVCDTLDEALVDCDLVLGASARRRTIDWPELSSHDAALLAAKESRVSKVAILFGRENSGLTNEELDRCHYLLHIPCNPDFSSLNLGAAVQVVTYELRMALMDASGVVKTAKKSEDRLSTANEVEAFYSHLEQTLYDIGFTQPERSRSLMRRMRRLYNRVRLEKKEIDILRGVFSMMKEKKERNRSSS
jgi:TrmH family RNA methyltransferase